MQHSSILEVLLGYNGTHILIDLCGTNILNKCCWCGEYQIIPCTDSTSDEFQLGMETPVVDKSLNIT